MSAIEYSYLLIEISEKLDELSPIHRLLFTCRTYLTSGSEGNIHDTLSLLKELEEQQNLGIDNLVVIKELLKGFREWSLFGKVKRFENKRKEYNALLEEIIRVLDELNDLERLVSVCRGKLSEESEGLIENVRSLFKELENQNILGLDRLDILKEILTETEKKDLLKKVEEFEERRNKEDEFERKKAQAAALASSVRNSLTGVVNMKTVFKLFAGGLVIVSATEVLSGWSSYDQLVAAVQSCVLPAGTSLVQITDGCVCLTVQAESLSALTNLWKLYQDGTLQKRLYDFFVTDEMRKLAEGEDVEVNVTIDEDEYQKACLELMNGAQEAELTGREERTRRNSDSVLYPSVKEELSMLKIKRIQAAFNQRMAVMEKEIEEVSLKVFGDRSAKRQQTIFKKIPYELEETKVQELKETEKGLEEHRLWQPHKVEPMDMEKFSLVQKYLEDVHETRSVTTEASDSALSTQAAISEFETEEISAERLCLRDLSQLVTSELNQRLKADATTMEKVSSYFGLKGDSFSFSFLPIEHFFPDTTVSVLKECFEALRLYDLAEILAKVKPCALCPVLSLEQVEKLQLGDRRTKHYRNMAVVVVDVSSEKSAAEMIETFFKDLNPKNEVNVIPNTNLRNKYLVRRNIKQLKQVEMRAIVQEKQLRYRLKIQLSKTRKRIEGEGQDKSKNPEGEGMLREGDSRCRRSYHDPSPIARVIVFPKEGQEKGKSPEGEAMGVVGDSRWFYHNPSIATVNIIPDELFLRKQLETKMEEITKLREGIKRETERIEDIEREESDVELAVLNVMDKWIQDQDGSTFIAVFLICTDHRAQHIFSERLYESIKERLASIPDHGKLVVSPPGWKSIGKIPETLHITLKQTHDDFVERKAVNDSQLFTSFIEIFKKRWPSLDLISMMREFKRTWRNHLEMKDNLSTLPRF